MKEKYNAALSTALHAWMVRDWEGLERALDILPDLFPDESGRKEALEFRRRVEEVARREEESVLRRAEGEPHPVQRVLILQRLDMIHKWKMKTLLRYYFALGRRYAVTPP